MIISKRIQRLSALISLCSVFFFAHAVHAATTLKIATLSPEGTALMVELRNAAKDITEQTDERVKFKFYSGGVMGDDFAVLRKMRARQLAGGMVQTGVFSRSAKNVNVYNLPMQFKDLDEVAAVRKEVDEDLEKELADAGYVSFGFVGIGLAYAMGNSPAQTIDEARRLKIWIPKGDAYAAKILESFGLTPIPLTMIDVLAGLQTGLIDTVASPPVAAIALQWHTQIDYVLNIPFLYVYSVYVVDKRTFDRIDPQDQTIVRNRMQVAIKRIEEIARQDHNSAMQAMLDQGIELLSPESQERETWQKIADQTALDWIDEGLIDRGMHERVQTSLAEFRAGHAQ